MFTAKFIKNIFLEAESIKAIGRSGKKTRVFAKQGDLDGSCTIYSLMMMLIFHHKLDWEDLIDGERAKDCEYVGRIQHEFLHGLNGLCTNGYKLREISDRANKCFGSKMCEAYTTEPDTPNTVSRSILQEMIRMYLDDRQPVMIGYSKPSGPGHALVVVAYRREARNRLRLFCLDPSHGVPFMHPWNTIIDLDYLTSDNDDFTDTNYWTEKKVCVNDFLVIIDDLPVESECPF
jgi:hypothetical protein